MKTDDILRNTEKRKEKNEDEKIKCIMEKEREEERGKVDKSGFLKLNEESKMRQSGD